MPAAALNETLTDVIVILDSTQSMQQHCKATKRYDLARWAVSDIVSVTPEGVRLGILELRDAVNELRKLESLRAEDRIRISRDLWTRRADGSGQLREALHRAALLIRRHENSVPLVVLLTDGEDCRPGEAYGAAAELLEATGAQVEFRVIAMCQDGQVSQQLQSLAEAAHGGFNLVDSRASLDQGLNDIMVRCREIRSARASKLAALMDRERDDSAAVRLQLQEKLRELQTVTEKANQLTVTLQQVTEQRNDLEKRFGEARTSVVSLEADTEQLKAETEQLQQTINEQQEQLTERQAVIAQNEKTITESAGDLEKANAASEQLRQDIAAEKSALKTVNQELSTVKVELEKAHDHETELINNTPNPFSMLIAMGFRRPWQS